MCIIFVIRVKINFPVFTSRSTYNRVLKTTTVNVQFNTTSDIVMNITIEPAAIFKIFTR